MPEKSGKRGNKQKAQRRKGKRGFTPLDQLTPHGEDGLYNVVVETPKGSPHKLDYDADLGAFKLGAVMPQGSTFPFDFGFIPRTKADDGDPLDVLVLMDHPLTPGTIVPSRLIGVISGEQTEKDGEVNENDRLIAVSPESPLLKDVKKLSDLPKELVDQIETFFVNYNEQRDKKFEPKGQHGPKKAEACFENARRKFKSSK
jgi:inorganic pyrophosphatase